MIGEATKQRLRPYVEKLKLWSIKRAVVEQNLKLHDAEIGDQYTNLEVARDSMLDIKLRAVHAFQIGLIRRALDGLPKGRDAVNLYDIGDSSGNHILMLKCFYGNLRTVSFNCDRNAVDKIKAKGLDAKLIRPDNRIGEWVSSGWLPRPDLVICLQTMEHMANLVSFIGRLKNITDTIVFTVPFVRKSRLGFYHMRGRNAGTSAEDLHVHELSPVDLDIVFRHYGWKRICKRTYYQYPRFSLFTCLLALFWSFVDYEGFYGAVYTRKDK